ncbi:50S ribosomal protein L22 [Patescibacteria group bacterium]|nr:50S ribosomal protein L22 [Patescibacteria group bacterium]MCL5091673.1 50S ribosomal protein L22 [Patescibacteria group bacterium]
MESQTYIKNLDVTPRKLRWLLPAIRPMRPVEALDYLYYTPKRAAKILHKAIRSAIVNAKATLKSRDDMLKFKLLTVEEGQKLKRYRAGGRGTAKPIVRRLSHIKIVLVGTPPPASAIKKPAAPVKTEKKRSSKSLRTTRKHGPKS